ncbi:dihydrofolate reductase family protein [Tropicibacter sp. Alg240-R139]|uniref:dihydrofolate reductase family protein n=1 Tax=Tropicibacter sp. Alg240-R139 TaxID=2305991 RepID=UPI0013E08F4F|nr:dihydrofolate reductase family protein [Tropicibacter sp. Alg240-R139]
MTTGHVFIATSLDGYVARPDHALDWLMKQPTVEGDDGGFSAFFDTVDGLIMGAGSFRTVAGFGKWPYTKPVIVMSHSMVSDDIPDDLKSKVELSQLEPAALMESLDARGWSRAYVDGGRLVQSFLRAGLIADLTITQVPILIGQGIPLFGELDRDIDLKLAGAKTLTSGMLQTTYRVL